jgi:hypothetical protein
MSANTPATLTVKKLEIHDPHQFNIKSNWEETEGDWDDRYVDFGGYFGSYGPHVFAAAPDLLEACEAFIALFNDCDMRPEDESHEVASTIRAAIKKAKGGKL